MRTLAMVQPLILLAALLAGCNKDGPTAPVPVATVSIAVPTPSPITGTVQTLVATPRSATGTALTGRAVTWQTSNAAAATISSAGVLTAVAPGSAMITATIEGKSGSTDIFVLPIPVATVTITPLTEQVVAGASIQMFARTTDAADRLLDGRLVSWTSSNTGVANVAGSGLLVATSPGTVTITATSEGKSGSIALTVAASPDAPTITSITPGLMIPGVNVTITGANFSASAMDNKVSIRGVDAVVQAASATQLTVTVPCVNSGAAQVSVTTANRTSAPFTQSVAVASRTIAVGQALILSGSAASACNELTGGASNARYLVTVFSAATSANTLIAFELSGNTPAPSAVAVPPTRVNTAQSRASIAMDAADNAQAGTDQAHWEHLERDRAELTRLQALARRTAGTRPTARLTAQAEPPAVGDSREFFLTFNAGCADVTRPMQTKAVYVGARAVIWEDGTNVLLSTENAELAGYYRRLGQIFDQDQFESLRNTFGDPLLRDTLTDNDGRIHMVYSQKLNGTGAAAYVTSCDQFARTLAPGSNFGEVFYGTVPTVAGSNVNSTAFADGWFYFMARTVVHEVKHIVSISARVQNNAPGEQSWLEEGTARHAEELWIRESLHKVPWKGNTGFGSASTNGIFCDFHPTDATCNAADVLRRPSYGMRRQFNEIRDKLVQPWNWSPYGDGTGQTGSVFYQTAWSLVRYAIDRHAASDAAFFKTLINSNLSGVNNLTAAAGATLDQLIGGWGLALFADDYPGIAAPSADLQFATWNLRSIYAGLNASPSWSTRFNTPFPIQPTQSAFGSFAFVQGGLRGGAHAYFEISGTAPAVQLISIRGAAGAIIPGQVRVAIARLQ